ncbi:GNAT family N-acetyltransferase [Motilimonas pumila]|uniref:N-acetyltransferase n=1 Tax=Motilimonas pumila TaxID=2303987 RepID=A0A418YDZ1_9GAMM|nr:GNAT family N-acetyltransferase [Motilimonas pumila]RJG42752.1 N-acetyltransferase [Motilimonas pumila]
MIEPIIASLTLADKPAVFSMLQDPEVMRFLGPQRALTDAEAEVWFNEHLLTPSRLVFKDKHTHALIGFCGVKQIAGQDDFGYFLLRQFWGQGLALKIIQMALIEIAKSQTLEQCQVFIDKDNGASLALANKLGWQRAGEQTEATSGKWRYFLA